MKIVLIYFLVFVSVHLSVGAARFIQNSHMGLFLGTSLMSSKTTKTRDNAGHNKVSKIKVAKVGRKVKEEKQEDGDEDQSADDQKAVEAQQQTWDNRRQIFFSILPILGYRIVGKVDFKSEKTIQICRLVFVAYLVLSQLLFWLLKQKIQSIADDTVVKTAPKFNLQNLQGMKMPGPLGEVLAGAAGQAPAAKAEAPKVTVKDYDLAEVSKLSNSVFFEVLTLSYLHFVTKQVQPLLMVPMMGIISKIQAPIVRIHLLGSKAVGNLARPFKTGMESFMEKMEKARVDGAAAPDTSESSADDAVAKDQTKAPVAVVSDTVEDEEDLDAADDVEPTIEEENGEEDSGDDDQEGDDDKVGDDGQDVKEDGDVEVVGDDGSASSGDDDKVKEEE